MTRAGDAWEGQTPPTLADFEIIASKALADLPPAFKARIGEVQLRIADFPEADVVAEMKLHSEFEILGLFQGVGMAHDADLPETGQLPNMIWLYRRPILDYWCEHDDSLGHLIRHVLIHEFGHHFGLSDDDMEALEEQAEAEADGTS